MISLFRRKEGQGSIDTLAHARLSRCIEELRLLQKYLQNTRAQLRIALEGLEFCAKDRVEASIDARILQASVALKAIRDLQ